MRHYEVVFFVHPSQSDQITSMIDRHKEIVTSSGGKVHRVEDWGRRKLAYPVNKLHKAHYVLLNIECDQKTLENLQYNFRFNDVVLRHLVMTKKSAETETSAMLIAIREEKEQEEKNRNRFVKERTENTTPPQAEQVAKQDKQDKQEDALPDTKNTAEDRPDESKEPEQEAE